MASVYMLKLPATDVFQILDALESRAESWKKTAAHYSGEENVGFPIEECRDKEEAESIAVHFRDIIEKIKTQINQDNTANKQDSK